MARWSQAWTSQGDELALAAQAEHAGLALGCAYSNSAEFDAELIAARRAAGVYGPKCQRRKAMKVVTTAAGLAIILVIVNLIV